MKNIGLFARKCALVLSGTLLSNKASYLMIGLVNRFLLGGKIQSIFLLYPASQQYVDAYCFRWYAKLMKWVPKLIGAYAQNGARGLIFGISSTDADFFDLRNLKNLKLLNDRFEQDRLLVGAKQKTYAGTLPGIMVKNDVLDECVEAQNTVDAVAKAVDQVIKGQQLPADPGIIVLGAEGFIGKKMVTRLSEQFTKIFPIDIKAPATLDQWPDSGEYPSAVILNVTKLGAIKDYFPLMRNGMIFVNEVYPEPSSDELAQMKKIGVKCFHVVGVRGRAWPRFPGAYAGGIPCCASIGERHLKGQKVEVVVLQK